ncbi:MAG: class I SAM-dependent DNA methyltransferase [Lachnospiraceae bacterium]
MEAYSNFSRSYDMFMDNVPYEEWSEYLCNLMEHYHIEKGLVLELGCGTGSMTELLAKRGYDMIGVDNSISMLEIAKEKSLANHSDVLYLFQDMREFELYGTVNAIISVCDSMNYMTTEEDMISVFKLANNYLEPGGYFIFDLNTVYKYQQLLADHTFAEDREQCSFIWENTYDEEDAINEYHLCLFQCRDDGLYEKYEEYHYQRAYSLEKIAELIDLGGMEYVTAYDAFTMEPPRTDSERIYVIAREKYHEGKTYLTSEEQE